VYKFATDEWLQAYKDAINASSELAEAASDWERDITLVVEAQPDKGVPIDLWGLFEVEHGRCKAATAVTPEVGDRAEYVIRAPYSRWREIIEGKLDPTRALLQGKLQVKGDLKALTQEVEATRALVRAAASVPTKFPDD
jgi:putative sterol carrier protein